MNYPVVQLLHLLAAILFVGTVFFEVIMLEGIRNKIPRPSMRAVEQNIGQRARRIMPWILLVLYAAGITLAWHHRAALAHPFGSSFALLLSIKILLAISVFAHFVTAMTMHHLGKLHSVHFKWIHVSVFMHVISIVVLTKAILYLHC